MTTSRFTSPRALAAPRRPRGRHVAAMTMVGALSAGALSVGGMVAGSAAGASSAAVRAHAAAAPTVWIARRGKLGTILVGSKGLTLYHFTKDKPGAIACSGGCLKVWPPLLLTRGARLRGGAGVSHLSVVSRPGVGRQVTYRGEPLYYYAGDTRPGQVSGQGVEGTWFVVHVSPAGSRAHARSHLTRPGSRLAAR